MPRPPFYIEKSRRFAARRVADRGWRFQGACRGFPRQVTLRSLTAFFFDRFAIWGRWGISSPKPLDWGPVPSPLPRFALMARCFVRSGAQRWFSR